MLDIFWSEHRPTSPALSRQYMSAILYHSEEQRRLAEESRDHLSAIVGQIHTRITPFERFYVAEDYHQKYYLRQERVLATEVRGMFADDEVAFRESTAAARVNGYVAAHGTPAQLMSEIDTLGLSEAGRSRLIASMGAESMSGSCGVGLQ